MIIIIIDLNYFLLYLFKNLNTDYVHINILLIVMIYIVYMKIPVVMVLMNVVQKLMKIYVKIKNQMDYLFIIDHSIIYSILILFYALIHGQSLS
jgi:hypothetical protein